MAGCKLLLEIEAARAPWDVDAVTREPTLTTIGNVVRGRAAVSRDETGREQVMRPGGRRLSVRKGGAPDGRPLLALDGAGSQVFARLLRAVAHEVGARPLAPDRPGFGGSDAQPGRSIVDWAHDVEPIADHIRLDAFAVLGISGGTPFAIATAARIAERVTRLAILGGVSPLDDPKVLEGASNHTRAGFALSRRAPRLMQSAFGRIRRPSPSRPRQGGARVVRHPRMLTFSRTLAPWPCYVTSFL